MQIHERLLGPAVTATAIAVLVLLVVFVVFGNTDTAIVVAAAAVLVGMFFLPPLRPCSARLRQPTRRRS